MIEAIKAGVPGAAVKDEMASLNPGGSIFLIRLKTRDLPCRDCTRTLPGYTARRS